MRTPVWTGPALALFAVIICTPPAAAQAQAPRVITMGGHGEVRATPDTAMLSAGVSTEGPTAAAALSANNGRMQAVMAAIKNLGVPDKDIRTSNFSVSPQYANSNNETPRITGYQASNQIEVRLEDVGKLGTALDTLATAGANQMHGVSFLIRDDAALLSQARAAAVTEARAKAETFAKAAGVGLGAILSISEEGAQGPRPLYAAAPMVMAKAVPVAMGEQSVNADVTIIWEIK
ncbi:MAG TPA: SIMPL domain-containing protein [Rhizomicrobium sp.]